MVIGTQFHSGLGTIQYLSTGFPGFVILVESLYKVWNGASARIWLQVYGFNQESFGQIAYLATETRIQSITSSKF